MPNDSVLPAQTIQSALQPHQPQRPTPLVPDARPRPGGWLTRLRARYVNTTRIDPRLRSWSAYANLLRGWHEHRRGATDVRARPVKLVFDATNACQLACPLCPTGLGMVDRRKGHADVALFASLLDQMGDDLFLVDFFNWGEPLLNPRLEDLLAMAHGRGIVSTINTNLSLKLSDERIERLVTSGVGEIAISLDGASAATHQRYRRNADFALIIDNMRRLVETRRRLGRTMPLITWQFIVFRFNEHELDAARALHQDIGVDSIIFRSPFLQTDRYDITPEDRAEIAGWTPANPAYGRHVDPPSVGKRCGWHYSMATVNWDGAVSPCCTTFRREHDFGTLGRKGEHTHATITNNDAFRTARAHIADPNAPGGDLICAKCPTPGIMDLQRYVYRRIALITVVALLETIRRGLRIPRLR